LDCRDHAGAFLGEQEPSKGNLEISTEKGGSYSKSAGGRTQERPVGMSTGKKLISILPFMGETGHALEERRTKRAT